MRAARWRHRSSDGFRLMADPAGNRIRPGGEGGSKRVDLRDFRRIWGRIPPALRERESWRRPAARTVRDPRATRAPNSAKSIKKKRIGRFGQWARRIPLFASARQWRIYGGVERFDGSAVARLRRIYMAQKANYVTLAKYACVSTPERTRDASWRLTGGAYYNKGEFLSFFAMGIYSSNNSWAGRIGARRWQVGCWPVRKIGRAVGSYGRMVRYAVLVDAGREHGAYCAPLYRLKQGGPGAGAVRS